MLIHGGCVQIVNKLNKIIFDVYEDGDRLKELLTIKSLLSQSNFKELKETISKDEKLIDLMNMVILVFTMEARILCIEGIETLMIKEVPFIVSHDIVESDYIKIENLSKYERVLYLIVMVLNLIDDKMIVSNPKED